MMQFAIFYFVCSIFVVNVFCQSNNPIWYSYQFGSGGANREELHVESVTSDPTFHFGKNVSSWKSITAGRKIYAVGLMETGVTILNIGLTLDREKFSTVGEVTGLNVTIADMELFNHWNQESKQTEIILVIASESELRWYKITETKLKLFWTWSVNRKVVELQHFKLLNQQNLLIVSKTENSRSVDIYKINLETSQYNLGLIQSFPFGDLDIATAINHFGSSTFLSLAPQHSNHVFIYKYTGCEFVSYQNITSANVNHLSSFKIGFKSFLTVGGQNAGIYQFTKKGIVKEEVRFALQNIFTWFPISTQTYRDDVILLFQREVEHSSHTSYFLEAAIYKENKFVIHDEIHCELHGETEYGISCIIDVEVRSGLMGSAVLSLGKILGLIVPGKEQSVLFLFKTQMKELKGPIDVQIKNLQEFKEMTEAKISMQDILKHVLYNDDLREHPLKNESEPSDSMDLRGPSLVKFVDQVQQQNISSDSQQSNELPTINDDQILERPWKYYEETKIPLDKPELQKLKREMMKIKIDIEYAKKKLSNAVQLNNSQPLLKKLTVNGDVQAGKKVSFENVFSETINRKDVDEVFSDTVRSNNLSLIQSNKTFLNLKVQSLSFEDLKDSRGSSQNGSLIRLNKNIEFFHPVTIKNNVMVASGKVNDHHFPNDVIIMGKTYEEPFKFEDIRVKESLEAKVINDLEMVSLENKRGDSRDDMKDGGLETLTVFGNITVERVNDEDFEGFLHSLCLTNIQTHIPGETTIDGELNIDGNLSTLFLNDLLFPDDYATTEMEYAVISGHKTFNGVVTTTEALVDQTINGIDFDSMIGLNFDQTLPDLIFQNLEVHNLDLQGTLDHPLINNFIPIPTLEESNVINVAAHFRNLDVTGDVVLSGNFNGHNFESRLNDVVYKDEENATIDSIKVMNLGLNVINGIQVESNKVNDIPLDSFVTTTSDQHLIMETLNGSVYFENLHLEGLLGDVNITELEQNTIKLEEDQIVSSTLIFENNNDDIDVTTTDFAIVGTLNNLTAADYFFTTETTRTFPADTNFDVVKVHTLSVDGNITASFNNFSMEDFEKNRLSLGGNQSVTAKYIVKNLTCTSLDSPSLNGSSLKSDMDFETYADEISTNLNEGKLKIENLHVNGSIFADLVNNENITQFQTNHWKTKNNYFNTAIFEGDVHLKAIDVRNLNGFDVAEVSKNLIFKNESDVTLDGSKVFENGFQVLKMLNSEHISGVHVDHVFRKTGHQVLMGPLTIEGNVLITSDFDVLENLNGVSTQYLLETYSFTDDVTTCIVKGDILMERLQDINHLVVQENVNKQNITEILENLVYLNANRKINGTTTFENKVHVKQNLNVEGTINDLDFSEFVDDMVLITEDAEIESDLLFTEPVVVKENIRVLTNLETPRLCDIDLKKWIDNAVYVNKGKIPGKVTFDSVTIHTDVNLNFINDLDLQSLIPLRTKQYINESLFFNEITPFHNISVKDSVNNLNLSNEIENSLLTTSDYQEVLSNVVFEGTILVRDNLTIWKVNNNTINQIVTTNSDQNLTGQYVFNQDVTFGSNLHVDGLVNGINISDWDTKSAKTVSEHPQVMTANWSSDANITFMEDVQTDGLIGEIDIRILENEVTNRSLQLSLMNSKAMDDYDNVCKDIKETAEKLEHQIYLFKYFDVFPHSTMDFDFNIKNVLYFAGNNGKYLMIFREDCQSNLYGWSNRQFRLISVVTLGSVEDIISVYDDDSLYFITKNDKLNPNCFPKGTNVWKFEQNQFKLIQKLEDSQVLQDSLIPGMFYTLNHGMVTRYSISPTSAIPAKANRKWKLKGSNYVSEIIKFVPKGLGTGLALSNGPSLFKLIPDNTKVNEVYDYNVDAFTWGKVIEEKNPFIFKPAENNIVVLNVGKGQNRKSLVAITYEEDTAVRGKFYFIKIYEDISKANLFQVIPTYKPSSLLSLEFGNNGETLFLFLENNEFLQVYEYKGLAGFRPRTRISTKAKKLVQMSLPCDGINESKILGLIGEKKIKLLKAVMVGNQFNIDQNLCALQHDSSPPV